MKKKLFAVMTAAVMSMAVLAGCGDVTAEDVQNAADQVAEQLPEEVVDAAQDAAEELNVSANDVADAVNEAADAAEDAAENLTYMGGLYISDENNDLTLVLVRDQNEGNIIAIVSKGDYFSYGIVDVTETKTTDDGTEYTAFTLDGNEYGYIFNENAEEGGILVDTDGTVYEAKFVDESAAKDYIAQAH